MIDIKHIEDEFIKYTDAFDMSNPNIRLKYDHTFRVCEQSVKICESLGLNEEDTLLAYLIALLHDIGRFEQIRVYNTFNDSKSIDHADFGCKLLFEEGLIRNFIADDKYDDIIKVAIRNHNKYNIEDGLDERSLLHSKIIRDADKIDIMYNTVTLGEIKIDDDNSIISDDVIKEFLSNKCIEHKKKKTKNDSVVMMLSFVFDLNFVYSYRYFIDNKFIELFYDKINNRDIFTTYVKKAKKYVEGKCNNVRC